MRGSADTSGIPDIKSRRAFLRFEIVCQGRPLEMKLKSTPDFSHSEIRAVPGPFLVVWFGHLFSQVFLSSSSVAAFRSSNCDSRNGVCFTTSRQVSEIIAPEAHHSHAGVLSIHPDGCSEGDWCMKDTDYPIRHLLRNLARYANTAKT